MSLELSSNLKRHLELLLAEDQAPQAAESLVKRVYHDPASLYSWESNLRYQELEMIGEGGSAVVFKAYDTVRRCSVAIKTVVDASHNDITGAAAREGLLLKQLAKNHTPHRLQWIDTYDASIITDFVPEKNIYEAYLAPDAPQGDLRFDEVITIFRQSLEFLRSLKEQQIVHGDLKPENMIYERSVRYLTILDCPRVVAGSKAHLEIMPTPNYRFPEEILKSSSNCSHDVWSLGCTIYELLTKTPLFTLDPYAPDLLDHLRQIADQIDLPTQEFLESCPKASLYYRLQPKVEFIHGSLNGKRARWDASLRIIGQQKQIPPRQMEQLICLLKGMLRYEDRWSPETLLTSPLFQEDIRFHLPADLPTGSKILIHRLTDVISAAFKPLKAVLTIDLESPVTRTCYHLPKDQLNHYVIFVNLPGPHMIPEIHINLQDGDTLDLKQHITQR